jgi:hypothetical protein
MLYARDRPMPFAQSSRIPSGEWHENRNVDNSNTDFTLMKDIAMHKRLKVQLRGEFFNAFNQVNFDPPESRVSAGPSFGKILTAQPARVVQLALKLMW